MMYLVVVRRCFWFRVFCLSIRARSSIIVVIRPVHLQHTECRQKELAAIQSINYLQESMALCIGSSFLFCQRFLS
jgi:hypothetical protein